MAFRGGSPGGTRQRKHWHGTVDATKDFTGTSTAIVSSFSIDGPVTILRTVGNILVSPTGGGTFVAADRARIVFGLGVVSTDAFAVGPSAMPDPGDEAEFDWLWWYITWIQVLDTGVGDDMGVNERIVVASKAMRKMSQRHTLVMIAQYADEAGAPPMTVQCGLRVLIGE